MLGMAQEAKVRWQGRLTSIQPRIRLLRSFDERQHTYLGYVLTLTGKLGDQDSVEFQVAIGPEAQAKHEFRVGDEGSGASVPVADEKAEVASWYKTSELGLISRGSEPPPEAGPPYHAVPLKLEEYRARGHRRLDARTYAAKCSTCVWGCKMPTQMIMDHWSRSRGPDNAKWRFETFCYGPEDCSVYKPGPIRKVPGRKPGMVHEDEGSTRG